MVLVRSERLSVLALTPLDASRSPQACLSLWRGFDVSGNACPTAGRRLKAARSPRRLHPPVTAEWVRLDPPGAGPLDGPRLPPAGVVVSLDLPSHGTSPIPDHFAAVPVSTAVATFHRSCHRRLARAFADGSLNSDRPT